MTVDVRLRPLPPGWATDLAVLELSGSRIEEHADHLLVRTPDNPGYHWGHVLLVTDPDAVGDAQRWVAAFGAASEMPRWRTLPACTSSAIAPQVSSTGVWGSTRCW